MMLQSTKLPNRGDKVGLFTHTSPHKPLRKINWSSAITKLTAHTTSGMMSDLVICEHRKGYGNTWCWMSLLRPSVIKQQNSNPVHKMVHLIRSTSLRANLKLLTVVHWTGIRSLNWQPVKKGHSFTYVHRLATSAMFYYALWSSQN